MMGLVRRLTARLAGRSSTAIPGIGLPCAVCGEPATGWAIRSRDRDGQQVIDGYAACAAHQAVDSLPRTKAG